MINYLMEYKKMYKNNKIKHLMIQIKLMNKIKILINNTQKDKSKI